MKENEKDRSEGNQEKQTKERNPARIFDPREPIERVNPFSVDSAEKFALDIQNEERET